MTTSAKKHESKNKGTVIVGTHSLSLYFVFAAIGLASAGYVVSEADAASAKIVNTEKAWQFKQNLSWDPDLRIIHSHIQSQIKIDNITDGTIYGRIADADGTTIGIYGKESVIMAKFGYANGLQGKWNIVAKPSGGFFSFAIPTKYADADFVKLWVNTNSFAIQPGIYDTEASQSERYIQNGNTIEVNSDRIFVIHGAPPLPSVDVSSDEGIELQHFAVYQGQIDVTVSSAMVSHELGD